MKSLLLALFGFGLLGCSFETNETYEPYETGAESTLESALLGSDTFLYFRCNATGWQPTPATRLVPVSAGAFELSYQVTQPWMVSGFDQCTFTETNARDGWGTWQGYYGADAPQPLAVPGNGKVRESGSDYFNVRYPALGKYKIRLSWPSGSFSIAAATSAPTPCTPNVETCNGVDDDCDGLVDESYLCMAAATAPAIDQLITRCPSKAVLDAIDQDFDLRFEHLDTDGDGDLDDPSPQGNTLVCTAAQGSRNLTQSQERLYQALIALRALSFSQTLPFTSKNLYAWMRDSIAGIRLRADVSGSSCCEPPSGKSGSYLNIQNDANRTFYVTDLWSTASGLGLMDLTQLLVHETRHANGPLHTCGVGNDQTIAELGSWGAVYHYARALAFNAQPCFLRPMLAASSKYPDQLFAADAYLVAARELSRTVHLTRFCSEPSVPAQPPEPVLACSQ